MLIAALALITCGTVILIARDIWNARSVPIVKPTDGIVAEGVSVLIPARDEVARIGRLLDGLAAQRDASFEVVVLDDHSTDGTAALVESYHSRLPNLRIIDGEPLPAGWTGKCWACWQAAAASRQPWLLFLDADTAPAPALIAALMARARSERLDFLSILPFLELETFAERLLMPPFTGLIQAVFPFPELNDPRSPLAMANGQCILVRRTAYDGSGGHAAVRDSVLEDVRLAQTVKSAGFRVELAAGPDLLRVRMYTSLAEISEGLRKNAWAGYSAGGWRSAWGGFRQAFLAVTPLATTLAGLLALAAGSPAAAPLLAAGSLLLLLTLGYWGYLAPRLFRLHPAWGLLFPLGTIGYFVLAGMAWFQIRGGAGVRWKGRAYRG